MADKSKNEKRDGRLLMFYTNNCEPCVVVEKVVKRLEKKENLKVDRLEVWYNQENKKLLRRYSDLATVPFFYNEVTSKKIVGEVDYDTLKNWAFGK